MASKKIQLSREELAAAFAGPDAERFPPIVSPSQVASLTGLSVKTIYDWMAKGHFNGTYRKRGKHCLFWRDRVVQQLFDGKEWT